MRTSPIVFVLAALSLDCATLTAIPERTCGNGVVDANEDCDSFPEACGKPGSGAGACRLTCDRKQAGSCPTGWGCSVEGFCREPTGTFGAASGPSSAGVTTLLVGDFDGDGRSDLLGGGPKNGTSKPRVHFYDSRGTPAPPVLLPFAMSSPTIRDFDRDGRDDLVFGFNSNNEFGAISVLVGTADRAFSPVLFPTVQKQQTALSLVMLPNDPPAGYLLPSGQGTAITVERDAKGTFFRSVSGGSFVGLKELELPAPMGPEQIVGRPSYGRVFNPFLAAPISACGDVVFSYNVGEEGHLAILSPCALAGAGPQASLGWSSRPARDVILPAKVDGRGVFVAATGAYASIIVSTTKGGFVAASDGVTLSAFVPLVDQNGTGFEAPLAYADVDGDGSGDLLIPTGLYVSGLGKDGDAGAADAGAADAGAAALGGTNVLRPGTGKWADARIANLNGDTLPDVVAFSPEALEIEFFANAGGSVFTRFSLSSNLPVRAIATGDFDGDRIQDVAFLASSRALADQDATGETELLVAYGKANGGPEPARVLGRFKEARALTIRHDVNKSVDDIVVVEASSSKGSLPTTSLTYLFNSGDRQSQAPLIFGDDAATAPAGKDRFRLWLPASLVAGPFLAPSSVDVMAIAYGITIKTDVKTQGLNAFATPFPTGVWFAQSDASVSGGLKGVKELLRFQPQALTALDGIRFRDEGIVETLIVSAEGDIDSPPDGVSEIVSLARSPAGTGTDLLVVRGKDIVAGKEPAQLSIKDFVVSGQDELALVDVDGDDLRDAVVLARGKNRDTLRIYRNDGKGSFVLSPIVLELPPAAPNNAPNTPPNTFDTPTGFARIVTGAVGGRARVELAIVTESRLLLATVTADKTKLDVRDVTPLLGLPLSHRLSGVAAGDFDGDGVQDLAVADSGSIRILRQQPRVQ